MLTALKQLGEYLRKEEKLSGLEVFMDLEKLKRYEKIISVDFVQEGGRYVYGGVSVHEMKDRGGKILYKSGSSRGGDRTPTSCITKPEKTVPRVFGWFERQDSDEPIILNIIHSYREHQDKIKKCVEDVFSTDTMSVLTVRFENGGKLRFIDSFEIFRDALKENEVSSWYKKHKVESKEDNTACSMCGRRNKVYGFAFPFNFYTVDNARYAPDFNRARSWQNVPLCEECAFDINIAKKVLNKQNFSFYIGENIKYFVVPEFHAGKFQKKIVELITKNVSNGDYTFLKAEEYCREFGGETPFNLTFIFYEQKQKSQKIHMYLEDVNPSWVLRSEDAADKTYKHIYRNTKAMEGGELVSLEDYLNESEEIKKLDKMMWWILPRIAKSTKSGKVILNEAFYLIEHILKGEDVYESRLVRLFVPEISFRFRNPKENYKKYTIQTFYILEFLRNLGILKGGGSEVKMKSYEQLMEKWKGVVNPTLSKFFSEFSESFNTPERRAAFLAGVLTQHLMNVQWIERKSDPFRKKLANLRIDEKRLKYIVTQTFNYLDIYNSKSEYNIRYSQMRHALSTCLLEAEQNKWQITDEELQYYFALGMSLNKVFKGGGGNGKDTG